MINILLFRAKIEPKIRAHIAQIAQNRKLWLLLSALCVIATASLAHKYQQYLAFIASDELVLKIERSYVKTRKQAAPPAPPNAQQQALSEGLSAAQSAWRKRREEKLQAAKATKSAAGAETVGGDKSADAVGEINLSGRVRKSKASGGLSGAGDVVDKFTGVDKFAGGGKFVDAVDEKNLSGRLLKSGASGGVGGGKFGAGAVVDKSADGDKSTGGVVDKSADNFDEKNSSVRLAKSLASGGISTGGTIVDKFTVDEKFVDTVGETNLSGRVRQIEASGGVSADNGETAKNLDETNSSGRVQKSLASGGVGGVVVEKSSADLAVKSASPKAARYRVIALRHGHLRIYSTVSAAEALAAGEFLRVRFYGLRALGFWEFLRGNLFLRGSFSRLAPPAPASPASPTSLATATPAAPTAPTAPTTLADKLANALAAAISAQHSHPKMQEFYGALFLALPISAELRNDVNYYGIAHLLAISGYHLGLLYACLAAGAATALWPLRASVLRVYHRGFFLAAFCFAALSVYFLLIGLVPSFFRSFCMAAAALLISLLGLKIFRFSNLALCAGFCCAAEPSLIFSVGFFFSSLGVFYIFLYAHHREPTIKINHIQKPTRPRFGARTGRFAQLAARARKAAVIARETIYFEAFIFFAMVIPVLAFFPLVTLQQLFALVLTPLFVLFYPLAMVCHLLGAGGVFDAALLEFLALKWPAAQLKIPTAALVAYLALSLAAVWRRRLLGVIFWLNAAIYLVFAAILV